MSPTAHALAFVTGSVALVCVLCRLVRRSPLRVCVGRWCRADSHQTLNAAADGDKLSHWESSRSISNYPTGSGKYSSISPVFSLLISISLDISPSPPAFCQSPPPHAPLSFHLSPVLFLLFIHPSSSLTFSFCFNRYHHLAACLSLRLSV